MRGLPQQDRVADLLNVRWAQHKQRHTEKALCTADLLQDFWCDASQDVLRREGGSLGALTPRCLWYSYEHDMTLDGIDSISLQGAPRNTCADFTSSELKNLAGESYHAASIGAYLYAYYLNPFAPWWKNK